MSSVAQAPAGGFAAGLRRTVVTVALLGLVVAGVVTLRPSWFDGGGDDAPAYAALSAAEPVQLSVGGIGLTAPLVASDRDPISTLATPPEDAPLVTWWEDSAEPGAAKGQTVLTAHASEKVGGLTALSGLAEGDFVDVVTRAGTMRYEVTGVHTLNPERLQKASIGLFKQDGGGGRLVAISTEQWDGSRYRRSVVVTAVPMGEPRA